MFVAPPPPEKFSALYKSTLNGTSEVMLMWLPAIQPTVGYNYSLEYQLTPKMFSPWQQKSDRGSVVLPAVSDVL